MKLCTIKMKICYVVQEFITEVAYLFIYYGEHILELTLKYNFHTCPKTYFISVVFKDLC